MSDSPPPESPSGLPPRRPSQEGSGCLTAILIVIGIILLLPGLCSLIFVFGGLVKNAEDVQFVALLMMVGAAGVALIWWAIRGRRR
jgi:hypothetical protein